MGEIARRFVGPSAEAGEPAKSDQIKGEQVSRDRALRSAGG